MIAISQKAGRIMLLFLIAVLILNSSLYAQNGGALTQYVNPFVGTAPLTNPEIIGYTPPKGWRVWAGLTYPGAALPNAMVQLSPITAFGTGAGYRYEDSVIYGFAHTNKGHWNLCHLPVLPVTGRIDSSHFGSRFDHGSETAHPGYYQVLLKDYDINVELTVTPHCGYHRYTFPHDSAQKILFYLGKSNERVRKWEIHQKGKRAISGYQLTGQPVYFYALLDHDIEKIDKGSDIAVVNLASGPENPVVEMKIGLSFVSAENAKANLEQELANKNFEITKKAANATWEKLLAHIKIKGGTDKERMLFYSSLYRSFLWPVLRSDVNGQYRDAKGEIVHADFKYYTNPSFWDTYRNKLVLLGMLAPHTTVDVIRSLMDKGEKTGFIPTFFFGDPASVFIAGTYLRGVRGFDLKKAYHLLVNNATLPDGARPHITEYMKKGYIATPQITHPNVETKAKAGVAATLEYAYADYALGLLAKAAGDSSGYHTFMKRSKNYQNVFDPGTGFMRGRLANGQWVHPFDPTYPYYEYMYREANAWQSTFYVPQDIAGLIRMFGSKERFAAKVDSLFSIPWNPQHIARNISSFIGQYCQGNQPDHNFPYLYYFVDEQPKTQRILNKIMHDLYGIGKTGLALPGMDDAGEMSAWYVFNAMGLYPFSPADPYYFVSVPLFSEVSLQLEGSRPFHIVRKGEGLHIRSLRLNGQSLNGLRLEHAQMDERPGKLVIVVE